MVSLYPGVKVPEEVDFIKDDETLLWGETCLLSKLVEATLAKLAGYS